MQRVFFIVAGLICLVLSDCIKEPWGDSCKNFKIPEDILNGDISKLCDDMYMPGCTIKNICANSTYSVMYPKFCTSFSIYKGLCTDMPGMTNCSNYKSMCMNNRSIVQQCDEETVNLMSTGDLAADIVSICSSMNMDGCDKCNSRGSGCNGLEVYSQLCMAMDMPMMCKDWTNMCTDIEKWPLCSNSINPAPSMIMYFHVGINEYFLFKELVPKEVWQYVLALIITFLASIGYELLKLLRFNLEKRLNSANHDRLINDHKKKREWTFKNSCNRAVFHFIEVTVGSLLMLLLMTFNVGICITIVLGRSVGAFIVGDRMDYLSQVSTAECH